MWDYFNKIYRGNFAEFQDELSGKLDREEKTFVITANPETLMIGQRDAEYGHPPNRTGHRCGNRTGTFQTSE